ncbi:MAG: hypothetical protein O7A04_10050 [Acidobacteria bacterium]|nr:hypothetical protein [Acidobacteriota bacterium]
MAADDFEVPAADVEWAVSEVFVAGDYFGGSGPAQTLTLVFLKDAGGLPGLAPVGCEFFGLPVPVGGSGDFLIPLPSVCSLPAGRYWLSVQAQMDHETGGQWMWRERTLQDGAPFAWQNPGDGFLTGCTSWTTAAACGASAPDLIFALAGAQVPVALQSFEVD